ncbi:MAG: YlbF family regulator [Lentilactobacillus diolivorans]|uniref:UPF0342 protein FC85_GL001072 n=2 Tax=Lentilactobacillus diolivorans TaxID=179838 RepID=A0A0R1S6H4_9LACO|nr:YlbF family regulator [Lentilactobacillus diolivorans]KRL64560.1 hypothetical protein FC85_GL001072 [Lentilactobacillus diolivorans DSM 14421]GEP22873.1 UPF0342 protein [Lentilactobacillus diolivorans]
MADKIMDTANQLQAELKASSEFADLKASYENLKSDPETFKLFKDFQELQLKLQQMQMQGQQPSEDEIKNAQAMAGKMGKNDIIADLMKKEKGVNNLLNDVNKVVTQPLMELYRN